MARKKLFIDGDIFGQYAQKLYKLGSMEYLKETTEKALVESKEYVTENLHKEMKRHRRSGRTEESISDDAKVTWEGTLASIKVGFKIPEGLASVFLMYGTPRVQPPDKKLYNAVYGPATSRKVAEIQEEVFDNALRKIMEEK